MNLIIDFPQPDFKIKEIDGSTKIFDVFRKKYVELTPEEWVRQNLLNALIINYNYPKGLIAVEKELIINKMKKRYDAVIFDRDRKPWMLIECKAPEIVLNESTLSQTLNYYRELQCPFLLVSNGKESFLAEVSASSFNWLCTAPTYNF